MDEEVYVYSPDPSLLKAGCYTLTLTGEEADAVRSALANHGDKMVLRALNAWTKKAEEDYTLVATACDAVLEKLNKAQGRE